MVLDTSNICNGNQLQKSIKANRNPKNNGMTGDINSSYKPVHAATTTHYDLRRQDSLTWFI